MRGLLTSARLRHAPARLLLGLTLFALVLALPLVNVVVAGTVANALGCRLDEANSYPCPVLGLDIGDLLAVMGVLGWFMLVTLPALALLAPVWLAVALWVLVRRWRSGRAEHPRTP